jgi:hypothetical protein
MKTSIAVLIISMSPLMALAQEDARDTVREMGGGPTSISPGADVTGAHRDTESIGRVQPRLPNTLESAQAGTVNKASKKPTKKREALLQKRALLVKEREAVGDAAAFQIKTAAQASPSEKPFVASQEKTAQDDARARAQQKWDSKHADELRRIDRALKGTSQGESVLPVRLPR